MIVEMREAAPIIHFGFLITKFDGSSGQPVTIWQKTMYNDKSHQVSIKASGAGITKISNNEFQVVFPSGGLKNIEVEVSTGIKKAVIKGNIIVLNVK